MPAELAENLYATSQFSAKNWASSLKPKNPNGAKKITFLGPVGSFPCKANAYTRSVTLTDGEATGWAQEIPAAIKNRDISSQQLEWHIGNLGFSQANLFGEFARTHPRPLYKKFYAGRFSPKLTGAEIQTLRWWVAVLTSLQPRIPRQCGRKPDLVIYSDSALLNRKIAAHALISSENGPVSSCWRRPLRPMRGLDAFKGATQSLGWE